MSRDESLQDDARDAVTALLAALENAANLDPGYVQHLAGELRALLSEATDDRTRGTAFNGRLIAIDGDVPPELPSPDAG